MQIEWLEEARDLLVFDGHARLRALEEGQKIEDLVLFLGVLESLTQPNDGTCPADFAETRELDVERVVHHLGYDAATECFAIHEISSVLVERRPRRGHRGLLGLARLQLDHRDTQGVRADRLVLIEGHR